MIPSKPTSKTSQNNYSAQSCVNGSDCQIEPNLKERFCVIAFPVERSPIRALIDAAENTTVSCGDCRS
jgi:hypothetical protein